MILNNNSIITLSSVFHVVDCISADRYFEQCTYTTKKNNSFLIIIIIIRLYDNVKNGRNNNIIVLLVISGRNSKRYENNIQ